MIYIFPTDTVYGIGCSIEDLDSVRKIREIKKRDRNKPFQILCANMQQVEELVADYNEGKQFIPYLPGALTIVFKKSDKVADEITSGLDSVGIRIPNHPELLAFMEVHGPLVATSLNISGEEPIVKKDDAIKFYKDAVYIDGKEPNLAIASTVVTTDGKVLRQGSIKLD